MLDRIINFLKDRIDNAYHCNISTQMPEGSMVTGSMSMLTGSMSMLTGSISSCGTEQASETCVPFFDIQFRNIFSQVKLDYIDKNINRLHEFLGYKKDLPS